MKLKLERIYDKPADLDGWRILIDRRWPRGISKVNAHLDEWAKEAAPSEELRKWFNHDPAKWEEFKLRYTAELEDKSAIVHCLLDLAKEKGLVLLFSARDLRFNQAVVLRGYLLSLDKEPEGGDHACD